MQQQKVGWNEGISLEVNFQTAYWWQYRSKACDMQEGENYERT